MEAFDLLVIQRQAAESRSPRVLFDLWEQVCRRYDRGYIGKYQLQEVKDIIWPKLRIMNKLRRAIDECYKKRSAAAVGKSNVLVITNRLPLKSAS